MSNISSSVSHFQWFFNAFALSAVDFVLKLETFELIDYEFDTRTGDLLKKQTDPILSADSIYVYGEVRKLGARHFVIEVCQHVYGTVPPSGKIEFVSDQDDAFHIDNFHYSVVIKDGKLIAHPDVILNSCSYRKSK